MRWTRRSRGGMGLRESERHFSCRWRRRRSTVDGRPSTLGAFHYMRLRGRAIAAKTWPTARRETLLRLALPAVRVEARRFAMPGSPTRVLCALGWSCRPTCANTRMSLRCRCRRLTRFSDFAAALGVGCDVRWASCLPSRRGMAQRRSRRERPSALARTASTRGRAFGAKTLRSRPVQNADKSRTARCAVAA